ncbi:MAG: hypothetical protein Q9213_003200 [Squamulea squamosa]
MASNHLPAKETTHQIHSTVPQTFPISQPFVYIQSDNQNDLEAARTKLYNELGLLPPNNDWTGEGWVKDQNGNYAYMIRAPTPNAPNPTKLIETRDQRHERINQLREAAFQREAAQPKKPRERKSQPDGYVDKRVLQKQRAEERKMTKREFRRNHPRVHEGGKTIPQAPSANSIMTRAKAKLKREKNEEGDGRFYFGSEKSFSSQKAKEIEDWKEKVGKEDVEMEDV